MIGTIGTDCFPVNYCGTDGSSVLTTASTSIASHVAAGQEPVQVFIDADGYVWVTIMTYQIDIFGSIFPHWVWLFRSLDPLSCDDVKSSGDAGYSPEGPGFTTWFEYICDGLAAGWDTYGTSGVCSNVSGEEPIIDIGTEPIALNTFYRRRERCCDTSTDPCNVPTEEDCEPAPDPDTDCAECCDASTAPTWVACDINTIADIPTACQFCELINGTWLLRRETAECVWSTCKLLEICTGHTTEYKYVTVTLFRQAIDNPAASSTFPCDWSVRISTSDTACPSVSPSAGIQIARFDTTPGMPGSTSPPINVPCNDWNEEPLGLTAGGSAACSSNLGWVYISAVA